MEQAKGLQREKRLRERHLLHNSLLVVGTIILFIFSIEIVVRMLPEGELVSEVHSCPSSREETVDSTGCNGLLRENPILYHRPFSLSYNLTKPAGTLRVVFLGDSMTVGHGVSPERRFTALVERWLDSLDRKCPECTSYEILNFGVNGYNLEQIEQVFYESLDFKPDLVIYDYFSNDDERLQLIVKKGMRVVGSYALRLPSMLSFPGSGWLLEHSRAYRFFSIKLGAIVRKLDQEPSFTKFHPLWPEVQEAFDGMIGAARRERVPFVIMYVPTFDASPLIDTNHSDGFIPSRCHSGVVIWDVPREIRKHYRTEDLRISEEDLHPNVAGHEAIAEALQPYFEKYVLNQSALGRLIPADDEKAGCTIV